MITVSSQRCGHASVKLRISVGKPRPSVTSSEESDTDDDDGDDDDETRVDEVSAFIVG